MIEFFEAHPELQRPKMSAAGVDPALKNSVGINVNPRDLELGSHAVLANHIRELFACFHDYLATWPILAGFLREVDIGDFYIQRYEPGGHFALMHSERTALPTLHRVLVWKTYLNDVEVGGRTHFTHYDLEVKPERAKTLIWPAEWTHAHTGRVDPRSHRQRGAGGNQIHHHRLDAFSAQGTAFRGGLITADSCAPA